MVKFIKIRELIKKRKNAFTRTALDKLNFFHILLLWCLMTLIFGLIYYGASGNKAHLLNTEFNETVNSISKSIYFSFATATTVSFSNMVPFGFFETVVIVQKIIGLLMLALVTSKFVSIKQNVILTEIYEISVYEKINRIRSSLLIFRQNISRLINKIEENSINRREIKDFYSHLSSFEDALNEILTLTVKSDKNGFIKILDAVNAQLLFTSILSSFEKLHELMLALDRNSLEWRRDVTLTLLQSCTNTADILFNKLTSSKMLAEKTINDLNQQKSKVTRLIADMIQQQNKESANEPAKVDIFSIKS